MRRITELEEKFDLLLEELGIEYGFLSGWDTLVLLLIFLLILSLCLGRREGLLWGLDVEGGLLVLERRK